MPQIIDFMYQGWSSYLPHDNAKFLSLLSSDHFQRSGSTSIAFIKYVDLEKKYIHYQVHTTSKTLNLWVQNNHCFERALALGGHLELKPAFQYVRKTKSTIAIDYPASQALLSLPCLAAHMADGPPLKPHEVTP